MLDRRDLMLIVAPIFIFANVAKDKLANLYNDAWIMHPRNAVSNRQLVLIHLSEFEF